MESDVAGEPVGHVRGEAVPSVSGDVVAANTELDGCLAVVPETVLAVVGLAAPFDGGRVPPQMHHPIEWGVRETGAGHAAGSGVFDGLQVGQQ